MFIKSTTNNSKEYRAVHTTKLDLEYMTPNVGAGRIVIAEPELSRVGTRATGRITLRLKYVLLSFTILALFSSQGFAQVVATKSRSTRIEPVPEYRADEALYGSYAGINNDTLLARYIAEAINVSPELKAIDRRADVYKSRIRQNNSLPDPRVNLALNNVPVNSFSLTQEPMTGKSIQLMQTFPFPGKLSTRGDIISQDVAITNEQYKDTYNKIVRDVSKTYYQMAYVHQAIKIETESRQLLRDISRTIRSKYEVGRGAQQDILKSDLEITRISDHILKLEGQLDQLNEEFNSYLLQPPGTDIRVDTIETISGHGVPRLTNGGLLQQVKRTNPALHSLEQAVEQARLKKHLAELDWYPDVTVSAGYSQRDYLGTPNNALADFVSLSVGINLPFNNGGKRSAAEAEASYQADMYREQYNRLLQQYQQSFGKMLARINVIVKRIELLEFGMLPQAAQALEASLASYQVGNVDYLTVLDNQIKLYDIQIELYKLRSDYWAELAEIQYILGGPVQ